MAYALRLARKVLEPFTAWGWWGAALVLEAVAMVLVYLWLNAG